jgi:large subunit ribosomal protein L4e
MAARPTVSVFQFDSPAQVVTTVPLPGVFTAPIRADVVNFVHTQMSKNARQAYGVNDLAGMQPAAQSWGTGRAVSRIPRVPGGGTHRAGQGAFGNMCRAGRMFAPTRVWRRWARKINQNQRRFALVSALAASALPSLVMARGHQIDSVPEVPLVLGGGVEGVQKTSQALKVLDRFGATPDVERCKNTKKIRAGSGKYRNRRYTVRKGPLVIYEKASGLEKAFRNIPGVDLAQVDRLNLLQLAPGGHLGRFIVWTQGAIQKLDAIYGTKEKKSTTKADYSLPQAMMSNTDVSRLINSDEVQKVLRPARITETLKKTMRKKNPLTNLGVMVKLNPYALAHRRAELRAEKARKDAKTSKTSKTSKVAPKKTNTKQERTAFYKKMIATE